MMKVFETAEQFEAAKNDARAVYLFTASWCPDCTAIEPFLPELVEKYDSIHFYEVNRDDFIDECQSHNIFGIPSFIAFSKGEEVARFVSKDRKTKEEVEAFLDEVIEKTK